LEIGWGKRRIAVFYWSASLILGISALFLKGTEKLLAFLSFFVILGVFILIIERVKKIR
jgi:UDP-GlcNAc:undecaprenyl-phosphate GlcNAc-1-phosphate transferase